MPRKILVLFAHPALERSRMNRRLAEAAAALPGVTFHDLYEEYPDLVIDVAREKELLVAHDAVVLQHPFYWYSCPAIVKEWMDQVLEHGWAYGTGGDALKGKLMMCALTTGGAQDAYQIGGRNRFTMRQLLAPQDQTAHLCGMRFLAPFVVHDALRIDAASAEPHVQSYKAFLEALRDDRIDLERALRAERIDEAIGASRSTDGASP